MATHVESVWLRRFRLHALEPQALPMADLSLCAAYVYRTCDAIAEFQNGQRSTLDGNAGIDHRRIPLASCQSSPPSESPPVAFGIFASLRLRRLPRLDEGVPAAA